MNKRTMLTLVQFGVIIIATVLAIGVITDWVIFNIYEDQPILLMAKIILSAGIYLIATAVTVSIRSVSKESLYERIIHNKEINVSYLNQYDAVVVDDIPVEGESCTFYLLPKDDLTIHVFLYVKVDETNEDVGAECEWREVGVLSTDLPWDTYEKVLKINKMDRFKYSVEDEIK